MKKIILLLMVVFLKITPVFAGEKEENENHVAFIWRPSIVIEKTDNFILGRKSAVGVELASNPTSQSFIRGGRVYPLAIRQNYYGDEIRRDSIWFFHPSADVYRYANVIDLDSIFFIRKLTELEINAVLMLMPEHLVEEFEGKEIWTFASAPVQWSSYIPLTRQRLVDVTGRQVSQAAGIEEPHDVIQYIQGLIALRQKVLNGEELPDPDGLDRFQRDIIQNTKRPETAEQKP